MMTDAELKERVRAILTEIDHDHEEAGTPIASFDFDTLDIDYQTSDSLADAVRLCSISSPRGGVNPYVDADAVLDEGGIIRIDDLAVSSVVIRNGAQQETTLMRSKPGDTTYDEEPIYGWVTNTGRVLYTTSLHPHDLDSIYQLVGGVMSAVPQTSIAAVHPSSFVRLVSVKLSDWVMPAHVVNAAESTIAIAQYGEYTRSGADNPVVVGDAGGDAAGQHGRVLRLYPAAESSDIELFVYDKDYEPDEGLLTKNKNYETGVCYMTAGLLLEKYNRYADADKMKAEAMKYIS